MHVLVAVAMLIGTPAVALVPDATFDAAAATAPSVEPAPEPEAAPDAEPAPEPELAPEAGAPVVTAPVAPAAIAVQAEPATPGTGTAAVTQSDSTGTFSLTAHRLWTGTGHGGPDQCGVSPANGYPDGDASPDDDVVCTGDTVGFRLAYEKADTAEPFTVQVDFDFNPYTDEIPAGLRTFCLGTGYGHTGELRGDGCLLTFPAGKSTEGVADFSYEAVREQTGEYFKFRLGAEWVTVSTWRIVSAVMDDPFLRLTSLASRPAVVTRDGVVGLEYKFDVDAKSLTIPGTSPTKGRSYWSLEESFVLDFTGFPAGSIVTSDRLTSDGDRTLSGTRSRWIYAIAPSITIFVPRTALPTVPTVFTGHIADHSLTVTDAAAPYRTNLQGQDQPGQGLPANTDTAGLLYDSATATTAPLVRNNDWVAQSYVPSMPDELVKKSYMWDVDGVPTPIDAAPWTVGRRGEGFWSVVTVRSWTGSADLLLCDNWADTSAQSLVATDRQPFVETWDPDSGTFVRRTVGVRYEYRTGPNQLYYNVTNCGDPASGAGWSATPTSTSTVMRVHLDDLALDGDNPVAARVYLPFVLGVPDPSGFAWDEVRAVWNPGVGSKWGSGSRVGVPFYDRRLNATVEAAWREAYFPVQEVRPGREIEARFTGMFAAYGSRASDDLTTDLTWSAEISSCFVPRPTGPWLPPASAEFPNGWRVTHSAPADPGPDGVPCTDDDGHGSRITAVATDAPLSTGRSFTIDVPGSVVPWAPAATNIVATTTVTVAGVEGLEPMTATNSRTVVTVDAAEVAQASRGLHVFEPVGADVAWESAFYNTTNVDQGASSYIEVLPYQGDARGTRLAGPLSRVRVALAGDAVGRTRVFATDAPPATVPNDVTAPGQADVDWCELDLVTGTAPCLTGEITALRYDVAALPAGFMGWRPSPPTPRARPTATTCATTSASAWCRRCPACYDERWRPRPCCSATASPAPSSTTPTSTRPSTPASDAWTVCP